MRVELVLVRPPGPSPYLAGFSPPAPASDEIQIVTPILTGVPSGQDMLFCSYMTSPWAQDVDITSADGAQSPFGHHAILYDVGTSGKPGDTHVCNDGDMTEARFLGAIGGEGGNVPIPDGVGIRLKAGGNIMVQTHWINTTSAPISGQAAFNVRGEAPSASRQPAQLFTILNTQFSVPPHANNEAVANCTIGQDVTLYMLLGHMHEYGSHLKIEQLAGGASGSSATLYEKVWQPEFQSNPPRNFYPLDAPLTFHKGDLVRVTCELGQLVGPIPGVPDGDVRGLWHVLPGDAGHHLHRRAVADEQLTQ